jgi:hypothetical protein
MTYPTRGSAVETHHVGADTDLIYNLGANPDANPNQDPSFQIKALTLDC